MRQYKSWIAALILGSTLSANAQQKNMENKTLNENIPEMIISLEKEALASTDPMAFVELSDTDVIYFDPSLDPDNQWKIIQTHWSYVKPLD